MNDAEARRKIREELDTTLVVEAAAGTGKTTELVRRILALVRSGRATLAGLVAVTFTEKAAGEMKLRLRTEIERARVDAGQESDERRRFDAALAELEAAHIGTIHGFCADLLRERPVEARVDPLFEVAAEEDHERLVDEAFEPWFQAAVAAPPPGVGRVLRRRSRERDAAGPKATLRAAGAQMIEQRDFDAPWSRPPFDRTAAVDAVVDDLRELGAMADRAAYKDGWLAKSLLEIQKQVGELDRREAVRAGVAGATRGVPGRDYDGLEAELRALERQRLWGWKGSGRWYAKEIERATVLEMKARTHTVLREVLERCDADLAACLFDELRPLVLAYESLKRRAGKLDFLDLLLLTRDLLKGDRAVRAELQARFTHLLVDEFQDTDPLQAEILLLLAADDPDQADAERARPVPGKLFVVGDPKQSIYRFRRADVSLYESIKRRLVADGASLVFLSTSFRSAPSLQRAVNAAFAPRMQGSEDGSQASYVALEPFRAEPAGRPTLIALPCPRPYGDYGKIVGFKIDDSFPDAVGAFVDWLLRSSGWTIQERGSDGDGKAIPIEARHVCLLFKRFQSFRDDVTRGYVRALESRRIPHVLVGGRSYHQREEVVAIRNVLAAVEWPDDELSVFATLRGPFLAVGDDALLAFRHQHGSLHPFKKLDPAKKSELTAPVIDALALLADLHRFRNRRPIADTIVAFLEATRAHAGVAIWPTGEQALANILRVLDLARRFEAGYALSFRSFVAHLKDEAERGGAGEAPVVEQGTDGVRMMTVHRSKGLEFPVVILVDPTAPRTRADPSRYVDARARMWAMPLAGCAPHELLEHRDVVLRHDEEESVRLAYVAATRARELFVVPVCGDEEQPGWLDVLADVVSPDPARKRDASPAPGCPAFGGDSVRDRPDNVPRGPEDSVAPGLHRARAGDHAVVWWDPHALELDREQVVGIRQQRILEADRDGVVATEGERLHAEWQARVAGARARGGAPSVVLSTVTEKKGAIAEAARAAPPPSAGGDAARAPGDAAGAAQGVAGSATTVGAAGAPVEISETTAERRQRPHGKRFGVLVHAVLATVDLDADAASVDAAAACQARMVGASREEADAAAAAVRAALAHPLLVRARAAQHRREASVLLALPDGSLVEGVLDLAFREVVDGAPIWTVVDFKTDVEITRRRAEYEAQVRLYAEAVARATREKARGALLSV